LQEAYVQNLQINKLGSSQINEACLDLQKARKDQSGAGCSFLDRSLTRSYAASALVMHGMGVQTVVG
jgi:hypothetical protein